MATPRAFFASLALLAGLPLSPTSILAAESYDNCTGFIDSIPAVISTQGVWCLRKNVSTANITGDAITINANNVTIDCNDFKIGGLAAGNTSQATGIHAVDRQNATVRHCSVRGFYRGIYLQNGAGHLVEENRLDNSLYIGIHILGTISGNNNRIRRNAVYDTGGAAGGIQAVGIMAHAEIIDNDIQGVFAAGASSYPVGVYAYGRVVSGNRVADLEVNGGGYALGITGYSNLTTAVGNYVFGNYDTAAGTGITSFLACANNIVTNFGTSYGTCYSSIGNL